MSKQIQTQASKVWQTVTDPATGETYKKTIDLTWTIVRETGYLVWLVICLVLVLGDWIWKTGYRTGWATREWINNLEKPSADRLLSETGKNLLEVSKSGAALAISTAKEQLGIEDTDEPLPVSKPKPEPVKVAAPEPKPLAVAPEPKPIAAVEPKPTAAPEGKPPTADE